MCVFKSTNISIDQKYYSLVYYLNMKEVEELIEEPQQTGGSIQRTGGKTEFFGQKIGWYWVRIRWFAIFLLCVELVVSLATLMIQVNRHIGEALNVSLLPVELLVMGMVGWRVAKDGRTKHALVAGFFLAALLGLLMAIVKSVIVGEVWTVYNLITEPVFAGMVGALVSGAVGVFVARKSYTAPSQPVSS